MSSMGNTMMGWAQRYVQSLANIRTGTVTSYNPEDHTAKVEYDCDDLVSDWLPVCNIMATDTLTFRAGLEVGSQVILVPLEHDSDSYVIMGANHSLANRPTKAPKTIGGEPAPTKAGELTVIAKGGGTMQFSDDGKVYFKATTFEVEAPTINSKGTWNHEGDINATGDVKAGSTSLKTHKHSGVQTGGGQSGGPV